MPVRVQVDVARDFHATARKLKAKGRGGVLREMNATLREGARPLVDEAQQRVRRVPIKGQRRARGGASARAARAKVALGKRKRPATEQQKQEAHQGAGLRDTIARAVSAKTSVSARSASLRVRAAQAKMPHDQRRLPAYVNRGHWRHPVFANRDNWVEQHAQPAWFDDAARQEGPPVRDKSIETVRKYLKNI